MLKVVRQVDRQKRYKLDRERERERERESVQQKEK